MTVTVHVISDPSELLKLEDAWNSFVGNWCENPTFFTGFVKESMESNISRGWNPVVVLMFVANRIVGVATLKTRRKFGIRYVRFLSESYLVAPDFVVEDQYREVFIEKILDFLLHTLRCQLVDLTLSMASPNTAILQKKCKTKKVPFWVAPAMGQRLLPVRCPWNEFAKSRGKEFRHEFRRIEGNLQLRGSWRVLCLDIMYNPYDVIDKILEVERMSWKEEWRRRKRHENLDQDLPLFFYGPLNPVAKRDFTCKVWFLELEGETLAYTLVLEYKRTAILAKTSYNRRFEKLSPGKYVCNAAIRELFESGQVDKIDFITDLPFHRTWTSLCTVRVRVIFSQKGVVPGLVVRLFYLLKERALRSLRGRIEPLETRKERLLTQYGISSKNAEVLAENKALGEFFEQCTKKYKRPDLLSNWLVGEFLSYLHEMNLELKDAKITPQHMVRMLQLIDDGTISIRIGKEILKKILVTGKSPVDIIKQDRIRIISDREYLQQLIDKILTSNSKAVEDLRARGEDRAVSFLVGLLMEETAGMADPQLATILVKNKLDALKVDKAE